MTVPIAKARLADGAWTPSAGERRAARMLERRLDLLGGSDLLDGSDQFGSGPTIIQRRQRVETALNAIRQVMNEVGPDIYRHDRISLYAVLRATILELSPLRLAIEDFAPDDPEAWMRAEMPDLEYRLWHAEATVKQLRELLAEVVPAVQPD